MPTTVSKRLICASVVWVLCFLSTNAFAAALTDETTVDFIRQRNAENRRRIETAVLREIVQENRRVSAVEENRRAQRTQGVLEVRDRAISEAVARGAGADHLDQIERQAAANLEWMEASLLLARLNSALTLERTTTFDFARDRARCDDKDLRDIDSIVRRHRLSDLDRLSVDRTMTVIAVADRPEVRLWHRAEPVATIMPAKGFRKESELSKFGIVPDGFLGEAFELQCRWSPDKEHVELTARARQTAGDVTVITLAAQLDFAMTRLVRRKDGKVVEEFVASDFRFVNGVYLPFRTRTVLSEIAPEYYVVECELKEASINQPLPEAETLFTIPEGYRVDDLSRQVIR